MSKGKFKTLIHNGVLFPDPYNAKGYILNNVKIPNDGPDSAEEMLWHYASKLDTEYVKSDIFNKNFYSCLKKTLPLTLKKLSFPKDFIPVLIKMKKDNEQIKEEKKLFQKSHKEEIEKYKTDLKEKYGFALLNGKKQPLGTYVIEGPGIFIQRGAGPMLGMWKYRTVPEDVIINYVGDKSKEPLPPVGHRWKKVEHNKNAMHIALYKVNIGNKFEKIKEIRFGNSSDVKADADQKKFAKAVELLQHMNEMEAYIKNGMNSDDLKTKQCGVASWLIQNTGIRVGSEKNLEIFADTVGMSTLKLKHISLIDKNYSDKYHISFDFLGKDSIRYINKIEIPYYVFKSLKSIIKNKKMEDEVFDLITADDINEFLSGCLPCVTAKLFRTAIASKLLVDAFKKQKVTKSMTLREKLHAFDMANLEVAKKLNHRKALPKNYDEQITKLNLQIQDALLKEKETTKKVKQNLKKIRDSISRSKRLLNGDALETSLKSLKDKERKEKDKLVKAEEKVKALQDRYDFKNNNGDIALGTSKTNYCTPEIAYSICNDLDIPIDKIYTKALQEKFAWAKNASKSYWRKYPNV